MPKCDFNKVALLHIFRTPFYKNTSGGLLLSFVNGVTDFRYYARKYCLMYAKLVL